MKDFKETLHKRLEDPDFKRVYTETLLEEKKIIQDKLNKLDLKYSLWLDELKIIENELGEIQDVN